MLNATSSLSETIRRRKIDSVRQRHPQGASEIDNIVEHNSSICDEERDEHILDLDKDRIAGHYIGIGGCSGGIFVGILGLAPYFTQGSFSKIQLATTTVGIVSALGLCYFSKKISDYNSRREELQHSRR